MDYKQFFCFRFCLRERTNCWKIGKTFFDEIRKLLCVYRNVLDNWNVNFFESFKISGVVSVPRFHLQCHLTMTLTHSQLQGCNSSEKAAIAGLPKLKFFSFVRWGDFINCVRRVRPQDVLNKTGAGLLSAVKFRRESQSVSHLAFFR